jgi:hypothetical protein
MATLDVIEGSIEPSAPGGDAVLAEIAVPAG